MPTLTAALKVRVMMERSKTGDLGLKLRIAVDSGGCAGFRYTFAWEKQAQPDDTILEDYVLIDPVSGPFLEDATIDFVSTLMGSDFKVTNPRTASGCGCGQSFSL